jgi:hypothetical protein
VDKYVFKGQPLHKLKRQAELNYLIVNLSNRFKKHVIMKVNNVLKALMLVCGLAAGATQAQTISADSTGLPGDNFILEAALEMFKNSASPEEFEKSLNTEGNKVNNLDLNEDGEIDYIRVIDKSETDAHAFILQAVISQSESQDIAVIELEKTSQENAIVQIVGDEDIYGQQQLVEPTETVKSNAGTTTKVVVVNAWAWPVVRYVYAPSYVVWVSPWRWRTYPVWYRPWRPVHYRVFHPYRAYYNNRYAVVKTHRAVHAHRVYTPVRTTSVTVRTRNQASVTRYRTTRTTTKTTVTKTGKKTTTRKTTTKGTRKRN